MLKVLVAIVIVPCLCPEFAFADIVYSKVPFPEPLLPDEMVIHGSLTVTLQEQSPAEAVIPILPLPADVLNVLSADEIE